MKYFGRSAKEQFDEYKEELERIERAILMDNGGEMLRLLELAQKACSYEGGSPMHDDPFALYNVQGEIRTLLLKLDADVKEKIAEHFMRRSK